MTREGIPAKTPPGHLCQSTPPITECIHVDRYIITYVACHTLYMKKKYYIYNLNHIQYTHTGSYLAGAAHLHTQSGIRAPEPGEGEHRRLDGHIVHI